MDFPFTVLDGRPPSEVTQRINNVLKTMNGQRAVISVKIASKPGRPNKRRYYFAAIVRPVCQALREAGNVMNEEETHTFLKREAGKLKKAIVMSDGKVKYTLKSYKELTPTEESNYLQACTVWATEMGIEIEPPTTWRK